MSDIFTKKKRSDVMSRIRSTGNKDTELVLARWLRAAGVTGWRRHAVIRFPVAGAKFRVKPDFVFHRARVAVFVDGCFWHACPRHATSPASNRTFWKQKLARNVARDRLVTGRLRRAGWRVLRFWEHDLRKTGEQKVIRRIQSAVANFQVR